MNCQGLATALERQDVLNCYKEEGYSILCLQDTHFTEGIELFVETQEGYTCLFNSYKSNTRGVAIMFNNNFEFKVNQTRTDNDGNLLVLDMVIEENKVTLIIIYMVRIPAHPIFMIWLEMFC